MQIITVLTVMTVQVAPHAGLRWPEHVLLRLVAVLAPLSAAQYAWTTLRKVQAQGGEPPPLESRVS